MRNGTAGRAGGWDGASLAFSNLQKWKWLNFWCNWEGQGTLFMSLCTVKPREKSDLKPLVWEHTPKPVIQLLSHDCIRKMCSELGQAVNERAESSSPAKSKLAARLRHQRAPLPAVQVCYPCGQVQNRIVSDPWSNTLSQLYQLRITPGTLTVWSVSGGSTICFSILFKTNFQSSFKTRFRTVFSQIFAETLKLE